MTELITPHDNKNSNKKNHWLVALVILLILLLTAQTTAVVYYLTRKDHSTSSTAGFKDADKSPRSYAGQHPRKSAAVTPYTRNFHKAYDPLFADALDSMSRLEDQFNHMLGQWRSSAPDMTDFFGGADDFDFMPTVDLEESAADYLVKVDLPGIDKDKINITVQNDLLTIQGVRQSESETSDEKSGMFKHERSYGSFARSLRLPGPVDDTRIAADYKNGVLTIKLPKVAAAAAEPKKIAIQ
ncbi:MAG: Hsp20/alpha crystallin family protein [Candidatus Omnitrophica bacterium]|nr:Hsp20/alpha crystallin family protein [Candidatus Omnitrophota bacterium]